MTSLTPELALSYLRELSADIRDGVVLSAEGELLAGRDELLEPARDALAAAPAAHVVEVSTVDGMVFAARSARYAIVLVCGRYALPSLIRYDLHTVLADLEGERPIQLPPGRHAA